MMDQEPSTTSAKPQDQNPAEDRQTIIKAAVTAVAILIAIGSIFLLIHKQFASPKDGQTYRDMAEARSHIVDLAQPRSVPVNGFTHYIPIDSRTEKRVETSLQDFSGKPVLLVLWATWCRPCHEELASLDRIYGSLTRAGLVVLPVLTADRSGIGGARYFYRGEDIRNLPLYTDHGQELLNTMRTKVLPTTVFINSQGQVVAFTSELDFSQEMSLSLLQSFARNDRLP